MPTPSSHHQPKPLRAYQRGGVIAKALACLVLLAVLAAAASMWWLRQPLALPDGKPSVSIVLPAGSSARQVAQAVVDAGVDAPVSLLYWYFRLSGKSGGLKAGTYEVEQGDTPPKLLAKLFSGLQSLRSVILLEGWNIRQMRAALAKAEFLKADTQALSEADLMTKLGKPGQHPEGRFFPNTYSYAKGSSDIVVLKAALRAMDKQLAAAWDARAANLALQSPEQALILASIIEKETGQSSDRPQVGSVFNNRLRLGMRLQTDPSVIYGLGESFDGNIRKSDLTTDTPYNTYTRAGLPPTPIAMPGKASLLAAVQPADSNALYFVARGDGSSEFSATLEAHNRAVNKYVRGQ
jgi:UPF0755 protein